MVFKTGLSLVEASTPTAHPEVKKKRNEEYEFGGPIGAFAIMAISHVLLYYVYFVIVHNEGNMWVPSDKAALQSALNTLVDSCLPDARSTVLYLGFIFAEAALAYVMPGLTLKGRADDKGEVLLYHCNAYLAWWASLAGIGYLHYAGIVPLYWIYENFGRVMTVAILFADVSSVLLYVYSFAARATHRMSGNHVYDFFMGAILHPRIGSLDIKMFAEIRISWFLLFLLTASAAASQYRVHGAVSASMQFMLLAHFLYANACAKGEHYVPPTWDIFYEKFGWMLCFWNFAGVPFLYCAQSVYIARHTVDVQSQLPNWALGLLTCVLLFAYYVWDTAQSQKNHFRLSFSGVPVTRVTFPYLPWQTIDKPTYIETAKKSPLLTDGWWKYARKIHYTCDIVMALSWGLACGFRHFIPYLYVIFFTSMIIHRYTRDVTRCSRKYGADWVRYTDTVPCAFIPGVI